MIIVGPTRVDLQDICQGQKYFHSTLLIGCFVLNNSLWNFGAKIADDLLSLLAKFSR